jgi:tetratricopeptide (TPR) repeat protein
LNPQ